MTRKERRLLRFQTEDNLRTKYRQLFLNEFKFVGFDYGVADFLMNKLLYQGRVAAFKLNNILEDELGFGTFSENQYDWKGDPLYIRILNEWNNKRVPSQKLLNNKDAVILELGFIPDNYIDEYVIRILDIQETIDVNLNAQKMPFIIKSTDSKTIKAIERLLDNADIVYAEDQMIDVLDLKVDYIIDKLTLYKSEVEAELLSVLGIDGIKFEKKAQMTKDEVNANNDEIDAYRKVIRDRVESFLNQINDVLGFNVSIEADQDEIFESEDDYDDY